MPDLMTVRAANSVVSSFAPEAGFKSNHFDEPTTSSQRIFIGLSLRCIASFLHKSLSLSHFETMNISKIWARYSNKLGGARDKNMESASNSGPSNPALTLITNISYMTFKKVRGEVLGWSKKTFDIF
jgi:hypothetical protein